MSFVVVAVAVGIVIRLISMIIVSVIFDFI